MYPVRVSRSSPPNDIGRIIHTRQPRISKQKLAAGRLANQFRGEVVIGNAIPSGVKCHHKVRAGLLRTGRFAAATKVDFFWRAKPQRIDFDVRIRIEVLFRSDLQTYRFGIRGDLVVVENLQSPSYNQGQDDVL